MAGTSADIGGEAGLASRQVVQRKEVRLGEIHDVDVIAHGRAIGCGYQDVANQRFDVVVNATSASLRGELPPVTPDVFAEEALAYELVYGKGLTPFLRLAHNAGVKRIADGVGMLVEQAAEAFVWWRGVRPDTRPLIDKLTIPLA